MKGGDEVMDEVTQRFEKIYNGTYDYLYKYLLLKADTRETVEDILQSVYLDFYKKLQEGANVLDPKHYLLRMVKHKIADHYSSRIVMESIDEAMEVVDEDALRKLERSDGFIYEEVLAHLKAADELTYKIFLLHFGYDLTIKETANALGVAEMTVKNRLYRTLKRLKKEIKEEGRYALFRSS